jgi:hypothetical protein
MHVQLDRSPSEESIDGFSQQLLLGPTRTCAASRRAPAASSVSRRFTAMPTCTRLVPVGTTWRIVTEAKYLSQWFCDKAHLHLVESGFHATPWPGAGKIKYRNEHEGGWEDFLGKLVAYGAQSQVPVFYLWMSGRRRTMRIARAD